MMVRKASHTTSQKLSSRLTIHHHIVKHFHKHVHRAISAYNRISHTIIHSGELIIIIVMGLSSYLFASFSGSLDAYMRENTAEVASYLAQAIEKPQNILTQGNLISVWKVPTTVYTSFTTGYCTYGAARISPEFFPYITSSLQQRTRGGNAVDWCENAAATGYKISNTPKVGSLIVYNGGGKFGPYGHVGKVMYYSKGLNKVIVRDMARVNTFMMSDHRQDTNDESIKCYIYNSRTGMPAITAPTEETGVISTGISTGTTIPSTEVIITGTHTAASDSPSSGGIVSVTTGTQSTNTSNNQALPVPSPTLLEKDIALDFTLLSDLGDFFVGQRDIEIHLRERTPFQIGKKQELLITIKNKKTGEPFSGLMPLPLEFINSQNTIGLDYSSINLVENGSFTLEISGDKVGTSVLLVTLGGEKIAKIGFTVEK